MVPAAATTAVPGAPEDTITRLRFVDQGRYLLAASWDSTVRLWSVAADAAAANAAAEPAATLSVDAPVLDACCLGDDNPALVAAGLVGGAVELLDLQAGGRPVTRLGSSDDASSSKPLASGARCVEWLPERGLVAVAGWDASLRLFDPRAGAAAQIARVPLPGKALAACVLPGTGGDSDSGSDRVAVATTGRHLWTYDARSLCDGAPPLERAQTALKGQVRALACWSGGGGDGGRGGVAAAAGVEGKVAVFGIAAAEASAAAGATTTSAVEPFAFKCHRGKGDAVSPNPVHAVAFHPRTGALLTGGGDGSVACWDAGSKKRLASLPLVAREGESEVVALAVADAGAGAGGGLVAVGLGSAVGRPVSSSLVLAPLSEAEVAPRGR
jgi:cell cycle arrest protein BUB3